MSHALVIVAVEPTNDVEKAIEEQMHPFREENEWFENGSRWDWYTTGGRYSGSLAGHNTVKRGDLNISAIEAYQEEEARKCWEQFCAEPEKRQKDKFTREYMYGLKDDDTLETVIERYKQRRISAYAFLRDKRWQENGRMGWFGGNTPTECELNCEHEGICLHTDEKTGAKIISYKYDKDSWSNNYFDRFIRDLPPEIILTGVDYHV